MARSIWISMGEDDIYSLLARQIGIWRNVYPARSISRPTFGTSSYQTCEELTDAYE